MEDTAGEEGLVGMMERTSLCMSSPTPGLAAHNGDESFLQSVQQHYTLQENNAVEHLVRLKTELKAASTFDFWRILMEGMTSITGAQYGFVAKRILVDDQDSAVEMPLIGEPGSCLLGVAFYYNDGREFINLHRDYEYFAYGAPCANMKHDKVFLIPSGLPQFITNNPNKFPFPSEAYLGVPLFAEGKCFAHFGMMWTVEGLKRRPLSWALIEMLLHSLEDLILDRLVDRQGFARLGDAHHAAKVISQDAVTAAQSLKPYARSLSHELRTPMQGVVGMLDVMHATVQESLEGQSDAVVGNVLKTLRENIEVVQDSSRRAVEAADNVVHAYDLNMQIPDTPVQHTDDDSMDAQSGFSPERRPSLLLENNSVFFRKNKRQRTTSVETTAPAAKHRVVQSSHSTPHRQIRGVSPHTAYLRSAVEESDEIVGSMGSVTRPSHTVDKGTPRRTPSTPEPGLPLDVPGSDFATTPGLRHTNVRELLHLVVNESLRVGGRPDSAVAEDTDGGELIEVWTKSAKGGGSCKIIEWSVDPRVPETIFVDERDLAKLVSCVFLNAIKFTEKGKISLHATLSSKSRYVVVNVVDTGPGIPQAFLPYLFKPFSREDDSLTRQKEGLGLGLLVAKGLARRIGGDLICVRSDTEGSRRGSEFELRIPISSSDTVTSRGSTPPRTSTPHAQRVIDSHVSKSRERQTSSLNRRRTPHKHGSTSTARYTDPSLLTKASSPLVPASASQRSSPSQQRAPPSRRPSTRKTLTFDRNLAKKYPLTFLVAEDNKINRKLLVNMLSKLGYTGVYEAENGAEAVQQMTIDRRARKEKAIDVVLMDLWMPSMDGYEATERIFAMEKDRRNKRIPNKDDDDRARRKRSLTILAVSADVTDSALERASEVGMGGFMTKPYKLIDLERLILEYCAGEQVAC